MGREREACGVNTSMWSSCGFAGLSGYLKPTQDKQINAWNSELRMSAGTGTQPGPANTAISQCVLNRCVWHPFKSMLGLTPLGRRVLRTAWARGAVCLPAHICLICSVHPHAVQNAPEGWARHCLYFFSVGVVKCVQWDLLLSWRSVLSHTPFFLCVF